MWTRIALALCALVGMLLPPATADAQRTPPDLYRLAESPATVTGVPGIERRDVLLLNQQVLGDVVSVIGQALRGQQRARITYPVTLRLFDGKSAELKLDLAERVTSTKFLVSGLVYADVGGVHRPVGQATLLVQTQLNGARLDGRILARQDHHLIRHIAGENYLLAVNPGALPPEAAPLPPMPVFAVATTAAAAPLDNAVEKCNPNEERTIRVLVLYTATARDGAAAAAARTAGLPPTTPIDGDEIMRNAAEVALGWANKALDNSKAKSRFSTSITARLVDAGYKEPADGGEVLAQLYAPSQALHQAASALRDDPAINADLVALVIEDWEYCGAAPVMIDWHMQRNQTAYSVVRRTCLDVKDNSLGHELAHSMGSAHDHKHARVPGLFRYSYGHAAEAAKLSTMMAYECVDCVRQPNYSNPLADFVSGDVPSGCPVNPTASANPACPAADNVRSLDRAACQATRWRKHP